ncbi:MAG TPA: WecB/TagA/CpsF family glycosyltransferase [Acidobacteriaceae bacterium]|jgi:N-acetylglucosaminyldiphosphoundecaprenol N-acetyl-beta-D-mannosaminyltransferase
MNHVDRRSIAVLGVPFDNVTMDEAVELIEEKIKDGGFHQVATANVDFLIHAIRDKELQAILCSCDLVVPDGMPIVWAARLMGSELKERVSGVDLVPRLAQLSSERGYGIYLLGASEQSSLRAAETLKKRFPGLRIVGRSSPPVVPLEEMDHEEILGQIERARPEILFVAMGNPKQEKWLAMHRDRLRVPVCVGVGGTLDFLAGTTCRAPKWMQESGLEWLHRACQDPGRLAKRYLNDAAGLALHLPPQVALSAAQPRKPVNSAVQAYDIGSSLVVVLSGDVNARTLTQLDQFMQRTGKTNRHVILDLELAGYLGPDTLGTLVRSAILMKRLRLEFWLAAVPAHLRRVFRGARLGHVFSTATSVADAAYRIEKIDQVLPSELIAARSLGPEARERINVQLEFLKDLCERIGSVSENAQFAFGGFRTRASAGR